MTEPQELTLHQRLRILEAGARRALKQFDQDLPEVFPSGNPPPAWCAIQALKAALRDAGLDEPPPDVPVSRDTEELTPQLPFEGAKS